jgi:hypothetical protein
MDLEDVLILNLLSRNKIYNNKHSRYRHLYLKQADIKSRQHRDRRIPRPSLHHPTLSSWTQIINSGNDQALITLTGFDLINLKWLSTLFTPIYDRYSPYVSPDGSIIPLQEGRGRNRLINGMDCLALCLAWTRTRGSCYVLQIMFGLTGSPISSYLRFGRRILIKVLVKNGYAAIKIPSEEKIAEYKAAILARHNLLKNVWCTMDGLKLTLQQSGNNRLQNNYYNGWKMDHYVSAVLVFCPDGTIPI